MIAVGRPTARSAALIGVGSVEYDQLARLDLSLTTTESMLAESSTTSGVCRTRLTVALQWQADEEEEHSNLRVSSDLERFQMEKQVPFEPRIGAGFSVP